jgi:hypothetical protein
VSLDVSPLVDAIHRQFEEEAKRWDQRESVSLWSLLYMVAAYIEGTPETRAFIDGLAEPPNVPPSKKREIEAIAAGLCKIAPIKGNARQDAVYSVILKIDNNQHLCSAAKCVGLFEYGCLAAHSCNPNMVFRISKDLSIVYRAVRRIEKGELATSSYADDLQQLWHTKRRRELLYSTKGFVCRCQRCLRPDRARAVRCPKCGQDEVMPSGRLIEIRREDAKPGDDYDVAKEIASTRYWFCQNPQCKAEFYNAEPPFSSEETLMAKVVAIEEQLTDPAPVADPAPMFKSIEELLKACKEILGSRHWTVGQLTYSLMVQLQVVAQKMHSRDVHIRSAKTAIEFYEWTKATASDCTVLVANAAFFAATLAEHLQLTRDAVPLYSAALPALELALGKDAPDVKHMREYIEGNKDK